MANTYFQFKQFRIDQEDCAMKVCTDACILGAWYAAKTTNWSAVLDIGSGTGLLMMMLAQRTDAQIHGIEIQAECFRQLEKNVHQNSWSERLQVFQGDARGYSFPLPYDFIISNPPFYENDLSSEKEGRQLAMHSKELNLEELIGVIVKNLAGSGSAGIMLPWHRAKGFTKLAEQHGLYLCEELSVKQTPKHDWFRFIGTYKFQKQETVVVTELAIKSEGIYTENFKDLMRGYYLQIA